MSENFHFVPATPDRWNDLEELFGERGACGGCWCMTWRLSPKEFNAGKEAKNKSRLRSLVKKGREPGVLAYAGEEAVGWCSVAPREEFPRLENSRVWKRIDDQPVWSITCLFVKRGFRNQGLSAQLLDAAAKFAKRHGARIVEGYPQDLGGKRLPYAFVWTGLAPAFHKAGFEVAERRSRQKPIMRRTLAK